jgi:tetratricopeptide (TPR) repeat protein
MPAIFYNSGYRAFGLLFTVILLSACQTPQVGPAKLADVDVSGAKNSNQKVFIQPKSEQEIRRAYADYLESANVNADDKSRIGALTRLAELEFRYGNKLLEEKRADGTSEADELIDQLYQERLNRTIELLATSLKDYPDAKNNDRLLYQIAKAYDQNNEHQQSIDALTTLVEKYPQSPFYVEVQFRIAEDAFALQDYSAAEYAYTEVIVAPENSIFYEKSVFKRGWARFKQQYYTDAVDDFLQAVIDHEFDEFEKLTKLEHEQFDEYFRAIGLSFSYLGGSDPLFEYFKDRSDFIYTYHTYSMVSDIYLKQERFSDAVDTHQQFIEKFPQSDNIPYSRLKIIEIWKNSGFAQKVYPAIEGFYVEYNPSSQYWKNQNENSRVNRAIRRALKEYVVLMTNYYHSRFQKSAKEADYKSATRWYQRYLQHYSAYAQNDGIYFLYGELLAQKNNLAQAFEYYELAAYDNDLIVHKDAAYASIITSNELLQDEANYEKYLGTHISYALKYAQQYSTDQRSQKLILHATELSFRSGRFKTTIELADLKLANDPSDVYLTSLKAASYYSLDDFSESETIYQAILLSDRITRQQRVDFGDKIALAIYKQGESAQQNNQILQAIRHYSRISKIAPKSEISATGLYDAIALSIQHKQWDGAISDIKRFQTLYPKSNYQVDISKKLSAAYLASDQGIKAAQELEKISTLGDDIATQAAALWKAATLYEEKGKTDEAIRSYGQYVKRNKKPFPQYLEAMNKLAELYSDKGLIKSRDKWYESIIEADNKALNNVKTDRTKYITSTSYLNLARNEKSRFDTLELSLPLKASLRKKKGSMQNSVKMYGNASVNQIYDIVTESTFSIAQIYKDFSESLLKSDRPKKLTDEQLDQYEILLEDQAFPFEDKAIEFFEINLSRTSEGLYNDWIDKSFKALISLYPARYNRKPKQDDYVAEMQ